MSRKMIKLRKEVDTQERIHQLQANIDMMNLKAKLLQEEIDMLKFKAMYNKKQLEK